MSNTDNIEYVTKLEDQLVRLLFKINKLEKKRSLIEQTLQYAKLRNTDLLDMGTLVNMENK
jgi:hypothetical protein